MTPTTPHPTPTPRERRAVGLVVAAGLLTVLAAAGPVPLAYAADHPSGIVLNVTDPAADASTMMIGRTAP
ncbi:hypothetical protein [Streptomyces sp. NBC_00459]|uniref:hypothetical protein n=1 Tax=Streptomyces sp. NBC_00459 TaxID=2975749 RepID=UPI002E18991C